MDSKAIELFVRLRELPADVNFFGSTFDVGSAELEAFYAAAVAEGKNECPVVLEFGEDEVPTFRDAPVSQQHELEAVVDAARVTELVRLLVEARQQLKDAEARGERKAIERLTAGVKVPESIAQFDWDNVELVWLTKYTFYEHHKKPLVLLSAAIEYGAAQRLEGVKEEREKCVEIAEKQMFKSDMTVADALRARGKA